MAKSYTVSARLEAKDNASPKIRGLRGAFESLESFVSSGLVRAFEVLPDPRRLAAQGLSIDDLERAIGHRPGVVDGQRDRFALARRVAGALVQRRTAAGDECECTVRRVVRTLNREARNAVVPGDYVDLRAEMDVLAVISNCPQMNNPVNDYNPTPVRVLLWNP